MLQQLQDGGEELQEDEGDAVLKRCELLSLQLREALKAQGIQRWAIIPASAPHDAGSC